MFKYFFFISEEICKVNCLQFVPKTFYLIDYLLVSFLIGVRLRKVLGVRITLNVRGVLAVEVGLGLPEKKVFPYYHFHK